MRIPLILVAIGGLIFVYFNGHRTWQMWTFGWTLNYLAMSAILLLAYGYQGRLVRTHAYRAVSSIGVYSYGIYLWHHSVAEPLFKVAAHIPSPIRWLSLLIMQYAAAIAVGITVTKAVEFPMLRLRERILPRGVAQLAPPPDGSTGRTGR
jgi:peptidoglycan/LPS O-acetylase OafA/YrhL